MNPAHHSRAAASNADAPTTPTAAAAPRFTRPSAEGPVLFSSSFTPTFDGEEAADFRSADSGGRRRACVSVHGHDYQYHRRPWRSPPQRSSNPGGGGLTPRAVGLRARDRCPPGDAGSAGGSGARMDAEEEVRGGPPSGWRLQSPDEYSCHQYPLMPTPMRAEQVRHPAAAGEGVAGIDGLPWTAPPPSSASGGGGGQCCRRTGSLLATLAPLQGVGGCGRAALWSPTVGSWAVMVDAPIPSVLRDPTRQPYAPSSYSVGALTGQSPSPAWTSGFGGRSAAEASTNPSVDLNRGRWSSTGNHCGGAGTHTGFHHGQECYRIVGQHRVLQLRDQHQAQQSPRQQHHQQQDQHLHQRLTFPAAGNAFALPTLGRRGSDPGTHSTAVPVLLPSRLSDSALPKYPLPGLAEAVVTVEGQAASGGNRRFSLGEPAVVPAAVAESAAPAATADALAAAGEGGRIEQRRCIKMLGSTVAFLVGFRFSTFFAFFCIAVGEKISRWERVLLPPHHSHVPSIGRTP